MAAETSVLAVGEKSAVFAQSANVNKSPTKCQHEMAITRKLRCVARLAVPTKRQQSANVLAFAGSYSRQRANVEAGRINRRNRTYTGSTERFSPTIALIKRLSHWAAWKNAPEAVAIKRFDPIDGAPA